MDHQDLLTAIDVYVETLFVPPEPSLTAAIADADAAGLPSINVSAVEGKLLYLLAKLSGARRVLEIGTLGGYSTIWLARALPADGTVLTLELEPAHARVARANLERAGVGDRVEIRVGPATAALEHLVKAGTKPFDVIFIDADKVSYPTYLEWSLKLVQPGSLILADNVIRNGAVTDPATSDESVQATQEFNRRLAAEPRLETIIVPVMRGHVDGLAIARVQ